MGSLDASSAGDADDTAPSVADVARYFGPTQADPLHVDAVFVQYFRERGLDGPVWQTFLNKLLGYGLEIVTRLVDSGSMFARCRRHGRHLHQQPVLPHEIEELASEAVMEGFVLFRDEGLVGGRWLIERETSLKEYFVNACVLSFPNVYRRWQTRRKAWCEVQLLESWSQMEPVATIRTPEDAVMARAAVDAVFKELGEDTRTLLFLYDQNYTHAEIAEIMRLTPRGVEGRLCRARKTARRLSEGGL